MPISTGSNIASGHTFPNRHPGLVPGSTGQQAWKLEALASRARSSGPRHKAGVTDVARGAQSRHPPLMRILVLTPLLLAATPLLGQDTLPPPPDLRFDVPANAGPTQVQLRGGIYKPGEGVSLHVHPGVEMAYVVQGTMEFRMHGEVLIKHAGDTTLI
ncbi:MAG: cupin domain-containing protein, partial [Alphaproteobacteria bacterium]